MKGLIIKELYNLKQVKNTYLLLVLVLLCYVWFTNKGNLVSTIPILIFSTSITSSFTLDHKSKWEKLMIAGPVSRKELVFSKYLFLLLIIMASSVLGIILSIPNLLSGATKANSLIELLLLSIAIALCSGGGIIGCAFSFRNTSEKMELLTLFSYVWTAVILFPLYKILNDINQKLNFPKIILFIVLTMIILLLFFVAMSVVAKRYEKNDML